MLLRVLIILLLAFSNIAHSETTEFPSSREYTANQIASLKGAAGSDLKSQLGLGSIYAENSDGFQDWDEAVKWYEKGFFSGKIDQIIGSPSDRVNNMQLWWHMTTYLKILEQRPGPDRAFKMAYMNALLFCNQQNGINYYEALKSANLAQYYNTNIAYAKPAQKLVDSLVKLIRLQELERARKLRK